MLNETAIAEVWRIVNELRSGEIVPNGTRKAITVAVDALRYAGAPSHQLDAACQVSAAIHKWEVALCRGDTEKQLAARTRLDEIGERWPLLVCAEPVCA